MIKTLQPVVHLIDHTMHAMQTCKTLIDVMTKEVDFVETSNGSSRYTGIENVLEMENDIVDFSKEPHGSVFESILLVFVIKNVSRAFQQQLTRTRIAGYSCASLRVMNVGSFADNGTYTMPNGLDTDQADYFHKTMLEMQKRYLELLKTGCPIEAARGILPLNIHSNVGLMINFQSLRHMLAIRLCNTAQGEFRQVALLIKDKVQEALGSTFANMLCRPCDLDGDCKRPKYYCGRFDQNA